MRFCVRFTDIFCTFAAEMKRTIVWMAALCLVLTGCKKGRTGDDREMSTFSQSGVTQRVKTADGTRTAEGSRTTTSRSPQGATSVTALDLLKQRVGRGTSEIMLTRKGYVTSYNKQTRTPNWVAWTLTKEHTYGSGQRENERFEEDLDVPTPRSTYQDFYDSRYDRGHMCPAGDNKWDEEAMTESFLMTNICPQNHGLNKEDWNDLEIQCRTWARRFGEVTVVCGPLFEDGDNARYIGRNKVRVPSGFFKVVYRTEPEEHAIGFVFANNGSRQPWREQVCSVDDIEERTGINFFTMLPDDVESTVEAEDNLRRAGW